LEALKKARCSTVRLKSFFVVFDWEGMEEEHLSKDMRLRAWKGSHRQASTIPATTDRDNEES